MTDKDTRARNDIYHVRPSFRGVLVYLTGAHAAIATATATNISWQAAAYDTLGAWNVNDPTKLVVPANTRYVRVSGSLDLDATAASVPTIEIYKNGSNSYPGVTRWYASTTLVDVGGVLQSPILVVTPGDYFTLNITQTSGANATVTQAYTWLSMEAVG